MAQANVFFRGEEKKFAINIAAAGFDMNTLKDDKGNSINDFDIEVTSGRGSISVKRTGDYNERGVWANETGSLVVFYEETTTGEPAETTKNWYCILDTGARVDPTDEKSDYILQTGQLTVTATAYVLDEKANDGVRKCIDQAVLGTLKNK